MSSVTPLWDIPSLVSTLTQLDVERIRLLCDNDALRQQIQTNYANVAALSTQVHELQKQNASMRVALHAIIHLQRAVDEAGLGGRALDNDDDADDNDEESLLELYELRRWKQQFALEQTRPLINRVEELTAHVHRLQQMLAGQTVATVGRADREDKC